MLDPTCAGQSCQSSALGRAARYKRRGDPTRRQNLSFRVHCRPPWRVAPPFAPGKETNQSLRIRRHLLQSFTFSTGPPVARLVWGQMPRTTRCMATLGTLGVSLAALCTLAAASSAIGVAPKPLCPQGGLCEPSRAEVMFTGNDVSAEVTFRH